MPLLNPNRPQVDFSSAKADYRSEMMRRDINGKVDGDGVKMGQAVETGVTIIAPLVVGKVFTPVETPQSLKSLGGLPETEATTAATNNAAKAEQSAKWVDETGKVIYPPNDGFAGTPTNITLKQGTIIDRYGRADGRFVSPKGTTYSERALAPGSEIKPYHIYKVVKPFECSAGKVASWFDEVGGGTQFKFDKTVQQLLDEGYLKEVTE